MSTSTRTRTTKSSSILWMSIEPSSTECRLTISVGLQGTVLKARLPAEPAHERAVMLLLEALSLWYGLPLHAVIDADALGVLQRPEKWSRWLGDAPAPHVQIEWVAVPQRRSADRFLEPMGDFLSSRRLLSFAATGRR